jgi:hypothetical protein
MSALRQTSSRGRVFCGAIALLVVVLLMGGIGVIGLTADARDLDCIYPNSAVLAEEDTAEDDESAAKLLGDKAYSEGLPVYGTSVAVADTLDQSITAEGQVAFGLRRGTIKRATHPTGPPTIRS